MPFWKCKWPISVINNSKSMVSVLNRSPVADLEICPMGGRWVAKLVAPCGGHLFFFFLLVLTGVGALASTPLDPLLGPKFSKLGCLIILEPSLVSGSRCFPITKIYCLKTLQVRLSAQGTVLRNMSWLVSLTRISYSKNLHPYWSWFHIECTLHLLLQVNNEAPVISLETILLGCLSYLPFISQGPGGTRVDGVRWVLMCRVLTHPPPGSIKDNPRDRSSVIVSIDTNWAFIFQICI